MFCENCGEYENLINMDQVKDKEGNLLYPDSCLLYCKECWDNRDILLEKCEKCHNDYQAYSCESGGKMISVGCMSCDEREFKWVCYNCKCDGTDCEYC